MLLFIHIIIVIAITLPWPMVLSDTNFYYQYNLSQTAKKEMKELTIFSWGGGADFTVSLQTRKGVQDVVSCAHRRVVSAI